MTALTMLNMTMYSSIANLLTEIKRQYILAAEKRRARAVIEPITAITNGPRFSSAQPGLGASAPGGSAML